MTPQFSIPVAVDSSLVDELGHVNNVEYLRWVEMVARAHSESLGFGLPRYRELNAVPVVRSHRILYRAPAMLNDQVTVSTRVDQIAGVRVIRLTRVTRGEVVLAEAETEWVWAHPETMRPVRIPEDVVRTFQALSN